MVQACPALPGYCLMTQDLVPPPGPWGRVEPGKDTGTWGKGKKPEGQHRSHKPPFLPTCVQARVREEKIFLYHSRIFWLV